MEISYSNISSNNQTANTNAVQEEQAVPNSKLQSYSGDMSGLSAGKVFKGEILEVKGQQVSIGLENGLVLNAKLESGIPLSVGQKFYFEVELNTGSRIEIKPVDFTLNPNPVLQKALQAANLPITDKNLAMVNNMIKEGMSIDKKSLSHMLRQLTINPETDMATIAKMSKFGIEVTKESIQQFENYKNYEHRIVKDINHIINQLSDLTREMGSNNTTDVVQWNKQLLAIFGGNSTTNQTVSGQEQLITNLPMSEVAIESATSRTPIENKVPLEAVSKEVAQSMEQSLPKLAEKMVGEQVRTSDNQVALTLETGKASVVQNQEQKQLLAVLDGSQREALADKLKQLGAEQSVLSSVKDGTIESKDLLNVIKTLTEQGKDEWSIKNLFQSKEYIEVLKQGIKQQWLIQPDDLKQTDKMSEYYKQMDEQTRQLVSLLETTGRTDTNVMKDVSNVRSNLNFMEQINQNFTYLQIPIQFSNQEAHSDLYVYTNKKSLKEKDGNLNVLLHLDMQVLGSTDIYLEMSHNQVSAKFSLQDKSAIKMIEDNLHTLIERIKEKGYHMTTMVEESQKEQDFIGDFLEKDQVVTSLKRYNFDVRT